MLNALSNFLLPTYKIPGDSGFNFAAAPALILMKLFFNQFQEDVLNGFLNELSK